MKSAVVGKSGWLHIQLRTRFFPIRIRQPCTLYSTIGYSVFHNLMEFTSKKMPNNILKNVCKKVFLLVKPLLAYLHSTISKKYSYMYSINQKNFISILTYEYPKNPEFCADFKSVEIIRKSEPRKSYLSKTVTSQQYRRGQTPTLYTSFACIFFVSKFFAFFSTVLKSA